MPELPMFDLSHLVCIALSSVIVRLMSCSFPCLQAFVVSHLCSNATVGVSNIEGPRQPISLAGHRVRAMSVSSYGLPLVSQSRGYITGSRLQAEYPGFQVLIQLMLIKRSITPGPGVN